MRLVVQTAIPVPKKSASSLHIAHASCWLVSERLASSRKRDEHCWERNKTAA